MSSEKKRAFAYCLAILCLVVALICYNLSPAKSPVSPPLRIHFSSVGGNILFDHQAHNESYELSCMECHHTVNSEQPMSAPCGSCHKATDEKIDVFGKNGTFDHDMHSEELDLTCSECHHNYSEDEGANPQLCSNCHNQEEGADSSLDRGTAFHLQCIGCHEDNGVSAGQNDCSVCHSPRKIMSAFHDQCIGCHENFGSGPSGDDSDCKYCHGF